jgi:hypothetical protein
MGTCAGQKEFFRLEKGLCPFIFPGEKSPCPVIFFVKKVSAPSFFWSKKVFAPSSELREKHPSNLQKRYYDYAQ